MDNVFAPPSKEAFRAAEDFLIEFGIPPSLCGFAPLAMCVAIASGQQDIGRCLVKKIYPTVVRELGLDIKPPNLTNRIASAIDACFVNCDYAKLEQFCGSCLNPDRVGIKNTEFIALAAIQVRRRLEDGIEKENKNV